MQIDAIDPELTLKATPPRAARTVVSRDRLALTHLPMRECSVLAIEAPAGFGKTSLLNQWRREALRQGAIVAWLALDERDTPERFVRGLQIALLLGCGADMPGHSIERLQGPQETPLESATAWLADVASLAREVVLLIDDLHTLPEGSAQEAIEYLILNAPANLKIFLGSRVALPESVLNVVPHGHFAVLTADNLRLLEGETERILRLQLGPRLDAAICATLHALSGGWPLGLQLMIPNVRSHPEGAKALPSLRADSGDLTLYFQQCFDERLDPKLADFLLRISIPDNISAGFAKALTGREDAAEVLTHLSTITPIFGQVMTQDWLRMHSLALDFLRERARRTFRPKEMQTLHLTASAWLAQNGMLEPAARHALAAGHTEVAFDLAQTCLPEILANGDFARVIAWFDRIPLAEAKRRPPIASAAAWALSMFVDRRPEALPLIEAVLENPMASPEASADAAAARLYHAFTQDDLQGAQSLYDRWRTEAGKGHRILDEMLTIFGAYAKLYSGEPALARYECQRLTDDGAGRPFFVTQASLTLLVAASHFWEGRVELAEAVVRPKADDALARFGRRSMAAAFWDVALATIAWERDEVESAAALLHDRLDLVESLQDFRLTAYGYLTAARVALHEGNEAQALQLLEHLAALGHARQLPRLIWQSLGEQIRIHAHAGRGRACTSLLAQMKALPGEQKTRSGPCSSPVFALKLHVAQAYTSIVNEDFRAALVHLDAADRMAARLQLGHDGIVIKLLASLAHRRLGEESDAILSEALSLARSCGLKRVVQDTHPELVPVVATLLAGEAQGGHRSPYPADLEGRSVRPLAVAKAVSPTRALLTPKEREVLSHLAEGSTNKRIAAVMEVSEETIKWHLKNLFAKLNGANRKHVVERARQIGLLE